MLDLNQFSDKDKSEIFHSSGYAQVGQGAQLGSAGNQTFQQRIEKANDQNRLVKGYHRSAVGAQRSVVRAKQFVPPTDSTQAANKSSRQAFNAGGEQRGSVVPPARNTASSHTFKEPPSRGYNPYS